jgi:hypothetical protein
MDSLQAERLRLPSLSAEQKRQSYFITYQNDVEKDIQALQIQLEQEELMGAAEDFHVRL